MGLTAVKRVIIRKICIPKQQSASESQINNDNYLLKSKVIYYDNPTEAVALIVLSINLNR